MSWFGRTPREEPPPLDGPLAALIEAEQIEVRAAEDVRSRVLQRARATPPMRLRVAPHRFWSRARAAAAAAIVFSLGVAASAAWRMAERSEPHPAPAATPPAVRPAAPARPEAVDPPEIVEEPAPPTPTPTPRRPARAHARPDSMVPAAEIALLEKARAAIARRSFAAALIPLGEHARQFPAGHLLEEREALRIRALTGLDRRADARRAAAAFRARFPHSILLRRIDELAPPGD
jgi:hypothetical protein